MMEERHKKRRITMEKEGRGENAGRLREEELEKRGERKGKRGTGERRNAPTRGEEGKGRRGGERAWKKKQQDG